MAEISQKHSFTEGFGDVLRSSAIFFVRQTDRMSTTISFMDYWKEKRDLDVAVVANVRAMDGTLIDRQRLRFGDGEVINYRPDLGDNAEGSVEIEIFSTENLFIPYPAVMALYETRDTISMVHSYARAYSRHEVEDGRTITRGEESNWTMRDSDGIRSFCVFHNGPGEQPAQTVRLTVRTLDGRRKDVEIPLGALGPYESVKLRPADFVEDLVEFLDGTPGQGSLSFTLRESFTRMLVGNEALDGSDFQVTHSDFNFNAHETDRVSDQGAAGLLRVPRPRGMDRWVVVYPEQDPGHYSISNGSEELSFASGEPQFIEVMENTGLFAFRKTDGLLPTRINTGIGCRANDRFLPAEPSLGVVHTEIPAKRLTWGPCIATDSLTTDIIVHAYDTVFGDVPTETTLGFRLYSANRKKYLERSVASAGLDAFNSGVPIEELFPEAREYLAGQPGYFTLYSDYGGLKAYVLMRKPSGSASLEHCF